MAKVTYLFLGQLIALAFAATNSFAIGDCERWYLATPPPLTSHAMAYDSDRHVIVMLGGVSPGFPGLY
ncbi:MAG TPA: hypothetical protein PLP17_14840, partial [Oligoflexia bacterium]|nr:hypothetical protein [Oligoflexia bacterium]